MTLKAQSDSQVLSLREVASRLNRLNSVIVKLEQNRSRVDVLELNEYCQAIEVNPHEPIAILVNHRPE